MVVEDGTSSRPASSYGSETGQRAAAGRATTWIGASEGRDATTHRWIVDHAKTVDARSRLFAHAHSERRAQGRSRNALAHIRTGRHLLLGDPVQVIKVRSDFNPSMGIGRCGTERSVAFNK